MINEFLRHRVTRNAGALVLLQSVNYLAPLIVLLYLTRVLGVETYGVVAFSVGIVHLSGVFIDFGFALSATHKISVWRDRKVYVSKFLGSIFLIKLIAFLIVAAGIFIYAVSSKKYEGFSELFLLSLFPVLGMGYQPDWFFMGIEKMKYITIFSVISKILFVLSIVILVSDESDYLWVPVSDGIARISAALVGIFFIYRSGYRIGMPGWRDIVYTIKVTWGFFVSRLSVMAYMSSGVVLLGIFSTPVSVAAYSLAEQLYKAMQSVFLPVIQAIYPYMAKEKNLSLFYKVAGGCVLVAIIGVSVGHMLAPQIIQIALGPGWLTSIAVLDIFFVALVVNVMTAMSGYPLAVAVNRVNIANRSVVCGSFVYVFCAAMLVIFDVVSAEAFAMIMIVAELYVLFYRAVTIWPHAYQVYKVNLRGSL